MPPRRRAPPPASLVYRTPPLFRPAAAAEAGEWGTTTRQKTRRGREEEREAAEAPKRGGEAGVRLRIFVCQKDETALLAPWIDHALSLVARPSDVRIVDDNSTDPGVLATLRAAEAAGIDVVRVAPPQPPAFRRKHILFTEWVHGCGAEGGGGGGGGGVAGEVCFFVPLDCDEFLAHRGPAPRPWEKLRLGRATLVLNTALSADRDAVRASLLALSASGPGTWTIRRLRNFSHAEALFADVREHKWCGVNRKIVVCGGGRVALRHPLAVPDRGYHATATGAQHGPTASLCLVEFHNLPYGLRQRKSLAMANLVPLHSRIKYRTEGRTSREDYEAAQEMAAHMQPTARSDRFAAIMHHLFSPGAPPLLGPPFLEEGLGPSTGGGDPFATSPAPAPPAPQDRVAGDGGGDDAGRSAEKSTAALLLPLLPAGGDRQEEQPPTPT